MSWKKIRENNTIIVWENDSVLVTDKGGIGLLLSVQYEKEDMLWYTILQTSKEKELYGGDFSTKTKAINKAKFLMRQYK